jgi:GTPase
VTLPSGASAIMSDTVGFISDLPVQLLDAFKVTCTVYCQVSAGLAPSQVPHQSTVALVYMVISHASAADEASIAA